jgi:deoxyribonuclease-4
MLIGAHLSTAGGILNPLESIVEKGGNCLQIFSSSPRMWGKANFTPEMMGNFIKKKKELGIDPVYFHASYLINLADSEITGSRSKMSLIAELKAASAMQIRGSIVHTGSFKKNKTPESYEVLLKNIKEILGETPDNSLLILENSAGDKIGQKLEKEVFNLAESIPLSELPLVKTTFL